jgi:hypothetical protein
MQTTLLAMAVTWFATSLWAADQTASFPATIEKSDDILPTKYRIVLPFNKPDTNPLKDKIYETNVTKRAFLLRETHSGLEIPIVSVRLKGAIDPAKPTVNGVAIDAKINPTNKYTVLVSLPNMPLVTYEASPLQGTGPKTNWLNFDTSFFHLEANPFGADGKAAGLKYDVSYTLTSLYKWGGLLKLKAQSNGEFSLTSGTNSDETIQNSIKAGVNGTYEYNIPATIPLFGETREYVYPLALKVAPAEFEMNKHFTIIDYTAKVLAGGALPYLDYPSLLWSRAMNLDVPFYPPAIFSGFAFVDNVKNNTSDSLAKLGHARWDTDLRYFMPLHERLDFYFSWSWYVGLEHSFWKNNVELGGILYMDDKRSQGFTLTWQRGSLPPEFLHTSSWRIGYTASFGAKK